MIEDFELSRELIRIFKDLAANKLDFERVSGSAHGPFCSTVRYEISISSLFRHLTDGEYVKKIEDARE